MSVTRGSLCEIEDCDRPRYRERSMCNPHYMRLYRYGDPHWTRPVRSVDLTGQRFGQLVAIERDGVSNWRCRCDCGEWRSIRTYSLTSGGTRGCGQHRRSDEVSYSAVHTRLRADRGPASAHPCTDCGGSARQWSYSHEDPNELRALEGAYSLDPDHYSPRCVSCHKRMDLSRIALRGI